MDDLHPESSRALFVVDAPEAAYRYASADHAETVIVLAEPDGTFAADGTGFDTVLVVGFGESPAVLRSVVEEAFAKAGDGGHVLIGAAGAIVDDAPDAWDAAFEGLGAVGLSFVPAPAVEVSRVPSHGTGAYLRGALAAIGASAPGAPISPVRHARPEVAPEKRSIARPSKPRRKTWIDLVREGMRRRRRLLVIGTIASLVLIGVSVGLVAILDEFFLAVLGTVVLLAVAALGLFMALHGRQVHRQLSALESVSRANRADIQSLNSRKNPGRLLDLVQVQSGEVTALRKSLIVNELATLETAKTLDRMQKGFKDAASQGLLREINLNSLGLFEQVQATLNLFGMVDIRAAVPPMRGWAVSPDALVLLVQEFVSLRPALVVECGSGISTLFLGLAAQQHGIDTRIVALDHEAEFAGKTNRMLAQHGIDHLAAARLAPLEAIATTAGEQPWYATSALDDLDGIGLLFVDGPPKQTSGLARFPALPQLWDRLTPTASIIMDDMIRVDEQEIVDRWIAEHPGLVREDFRTEKATTILRRS